MNKPALTPEAASPSSTRTIRFETGTHAASLRNDRKVEVKGALSADGTRLEASFIHVEL